MLKNTEINYLRIPEFLKRFPSVINFIEKRTGLDEVKYFLSKHGKKKNFHFIDEVFEYLDFTFSFSIKDKERIPSNGKLIIVANHPSGGLDGLILLRLLKEVRSDVKVVANNKLLELENLKELFLPIDIVDQKNQIKNIREIGNLLKNDAALIFFPAGEVSRFNFNRIKDKKWNAGVIKFSLKYNCPILPIFINARNSPSFYILSLINRKFSEYFLIKELLKKRSKSLKIKIGDQIPADSFSNDRIHIRKNIELLRKHTYLIDKNYRDVLKTEKNIIPSISKDILKSEISNCNVLGDTYDFKKILLTNSRNSPNILREVGRLREVTFRKVGNGTGKKLDVDMYDSVYEHIILWDPSELEIIGSYRIGICKNLINKNDINNLYTSTLFNFSPAFIKLLPNSLELGRSFIQSKYWNSKALDYLWQGIGAFLKNNKDIKYLFGGVSLNNNYTQSVKELIVFFFQKWFDQYAHLASGKNRFVLSKDRKEELLKIFSEDNFNTEMLLLKNLLKESGHSMPILFKHYLNLCDYGGTKFIDFTVDSSFKNSVDGLILVDIDKIKDNKKNRYIKSTNNKVKYLSMEIMVE